jgi:hypothetical protein
MPWRGPVRGSRPAMKLRPRDNLDQYILSSRSQARRLSIAIGRGPPRPQWSPDHELRKGRRQAAKSWGGGRSSPTSPASRLPTPSTEGARVGSRPPQGNEDDRISVHRVHKVSSGRSARIEPSALCLKKLACCAVVARQRGEARRHELAPDRYLHVPAGWGRREPDIVNRDGGRRMWVETGSIRLASVSQLGDQVSFHISFLALYSSS